MGRIRHPKSDRKPRGRDCSDSPEVAGAGAEAAEDYKRKARKPPKKIRYQDIRNRA